MFQEVCFFNNDQCDGCDDENPVEDDFDQLDRPGHRTAAGRPVLPLSYRFNVIFLHH